MRVENNYMAIDGETVSIRAFRREARGFESSYRQSTPSAGSIRLIATVFMKMTQVAVSLIKREKGESV